MSIELLNAIGKSVSKWSCLSTDTKPTTGNYGSRCFETDKKRWYIYTPAGWIPDPGSELNRFQQDVTAARLTGAATVVASAVPAYLLGVMFDALTVGLVTVKDGTTILQIIPVGTSGGQMIPLFGVKCSTNITIVLAGADVGTAYSVPVS